MKVTAIFESWHIGDGNYPPLARGDLVRLSFELEPTSVAPSMVSAEPWIEHLGDAEYRGVGRVLRRYRDENDALAVVEAGGFRFYINSAEAAPLTPGAWVHFAGTLLLDHYIWVEYLHTYPDPPDLFYSLRVAGIRRVRVPDRFVSRHEGGKALPTRVGPADFAEVEELATMEGCAFDEEFFIVDFDGAGLEGVDIPLTFQ